MNIPKRPAFHHFMRSSRLLSPGRGPDAADASCAAATDAMTGIPTLAANSDVLVPFKRLGRV
jgi:hypothetical protein